jgi:transcriptional regulatory protein LevR/transcriptional regulator with AAA-type ATPase domain
VIYLKKSEIVYDYINGKVTLELILDNFKNNISFGVDAQEIEKHFNIVRNNASTILNELLKNNMLVKINSRPVTFIPKHIISNLNLSEEQKNNNIFSYEEFNEILQQFTNNGEDFDPFSYLIGFKSSLSHQVEQAKTAIMYPPHGLHTLILGESGVGKTTFVSAIYHYAKINKNLDSENFPFISFNCSDYFNASQLLLSQLFGHAKGAFTGADIDKIGLVEKANNGILFLDEVHRLPPDGQEMLFYLMDKGEFCRLGETKPKKSNVLIICATTENPNDTFLSTFLRRIPVTINLPSYRGKNIEEKFEVIEKLFHNEAVKLNMPIRISPKVIKALAVYDFNVGNIGELNSEIKLLSAKAFFEYLKCKKELNVNFKMLTGKIKEHFLNNTTNKDMVFLNMFTKDVIIRPSDNLTKKYNSLSLNNDDDIYDSINKKMEQLKKLGISKEQIESEITNELENHFNSVVNKFNPDDMNIRNLYKVIPNDIVNVSIELINFAQAELKTRFSNKFFFGFTFHIYSLIKRLKENKAIKNPNIAIIKRQHKNEFIVASKLVLILSEKLALLIPEDEKGFLAVLLANNKIDDVINDYIGIVLVCHGDSTASSIASVANKLLGVNNIKAVDMPLDCKVEDIYQNVKSEVSAVNNGHGVLILADMGSLLNFGEKIMNETGIKVRTIKNVSTPLALDALRSVLYKKESLDDIYNSLTIPETFDKVNKVSKKKKTIITVCITGQGASLVARDILINLLDESYKTKIDIIAINYNDIENDLINITEKYDIIACIGSFKPNINVPYFPINKLLSRSFQSEFIKFLDSNLINSEHSDREEDVKSVYETSKEMLEQYVKYINPKLAIAIIKKFIENMDLNYNENNQDNLLDLLIHMGCMLDRCVHGDLIKFEKLQEFKHNNISHFNKIKDACPILEKAYDISISDDEICYVIRVLQK